MVDALSPVRSAIEVRDQCVVLRGISSSVATITSLTRSSGIDGGRPGRTSSARPSRWCSRNLACSRKTRPPVQSRSTVTNVMTRNT